jgi:hypothetical protein
VLDESPSSIGKVRAVALVALGPWLRSQLYDSTGASVTCAQICRPARPFVGRHSLHEQQAIVSLQHKELIA